VQAHPRWFQEGPKRTRVRAPGGIILAVPRELQEKLAKYQQLYQQMQMMAAQKQQYQSHINEIEFALEEIDGLPHGATLYKAAGALLIKTEDVAGIKGALGERKEELEIKMKGVEKQEKQLQGLYERLRNELNEAVQSS
jgi:prefoldin beta subunit